MQMRTRRVEREGFISQCQIFPSDEHTTVEITSFLGTISVLDWPVSCWRFRLPSVHQSFYLDAYESKYHKKKKETQSRRLGERPSAFSPQVGPTVSNTW